MLIGENRSENEKRLCERITDLVDEEYDSNLVIDAVAGVSKVSLEVALDLEPSSINQPDEHGRTALHWAAIKGNHEAVTTLIRYKADITLQD